MAIPNFFRQFFPIYTSLFGKKLELPFLAIPNFYQSFWKKLSKKFGMAIFGHSEFFSDNFSVHITLLECNGLKSNEIYTFLDFNSEI